MGNCLGYLSILLGGGGSSGIGGLGGCIGGFNCCGRMLWFNNM